MDKKFLRSVLVAFFVATSSALAGPIQSKCLQSSARLRCDTIRLKLSKVLPGNIRVRYGVQSPKGGPIKGDILYIHGFADRLDNHAPLFDAWNEAGFRVIAFDLPGHGENSGSLNDINLWPFQKLAEIAVAVEKRTRANRPLVLAGWSTGGLLATRMLQGVGFPSFGRPVQAAILFAPGISLRPPHEFGEKVPDFKLGMIGRVTMNSLTHNLNPPHNGPIKPLSPLTEAGFAKNVLFNSTLATHQGYPQGVPTLVIVGGDAEDVYAHTGKVQEWAAARRDEGKRIWTIQCAGAKHELDNEAEPVGWTVRTIAADFVRESIAGTPEAIGRFEEACRF